MNKNYGVDRVEQPQKVLPTSAWKINNRSELSPNEMRIAIDIIHIEGTAFRHLCNSSPDDEKLCEKIKELVNLRGKLHNPATDTGGLLTGTIEEVGSDYVFSDRLKEGDKVICNTSLTGVPLKIEEISAVDRAFGQITAKGYAIVYGDIPVIKRPEDLSAKMLLFAFNESGTLYNVFDLAKGKKTFIVVGNNLITNLMYGYTIRKAAGEDVQITCLMDKTTNTVIQHGRVDELIDKVFNEVHYLNILRPMECMERLEADGNFDLSVNCADIPGAETVNILATKKGGNVVFANLINNYNIALYITEAIARELKIDCAAGFTEEYGAFNIDIVEGLAPYFEGAQVIQQKGDYTAVEKLSEGRGGEIRKDFISESRSMRKVLDSIFNIANYDCNVLITGETGVGKEKVAELINSNSKRKFAKFIKINCATITQNLMESEFFGYEEGAFSGAKKGGKKGFFEVADNGMVFLDEVGELPLDIQAKLLRVIQEGKFHRVGGAEEISTNVRIIAATNRDLEAEVAEGKFRKDLFYRLNVFPIRVPPLREREGDIAPLSEFFLRKYGENFGVKKGINPDAIEYLEAQQWPGNIRELENTIQRLIVNSDGENITALDVMKEVHDKIFDIDSELVEEIMLSGDMDLHQIMEQFEKEIIRRAYELHGSTRKAASHLKISQTQMSRKKKKYGF